MNRNPDLAVHKYLLEPTDVQLLELPPGARLLSVAEQHEQIVLYALVNVLVTERCYRRVHVVGTGNPFPEGVSADDFLGTVRLRGGALMFHVFAAQENADASR